VIAELRQFLTTWRGWTHDEHGSGYRQTSWLNADQACVEITPRKQHVHLLIEESGRGHKESRRAARSTRRAPTAAGFQNQNEDQTVPFS